MFECFLLISSTHSVSVSWWVEITRAMRGIYTFMHFSLRFTSLYSLNIWVTARREAGTSSAVVMHVFWLQWICPTRCNPPLCATGSAGCHCDPLAIVGSIKRPLLSSQLPPSNTACVFNAYIPRPKENKPGPFDWIHNGVV